MKVELIEELFEGVEADFSKHLLLPNNDRIIFSGKYGAGKTTFLNYYFQSNKDNYNVVKLNPIDYSIAINQDVFKYIKYDILYHMLENEQVEFKTFDFSKLETGSQFLKDNILDVLTSFLPLIPKFGGSIDKVYKNLKKLNDNYAEFHKETTKNHDKEELGGFMFKITDQEGSIYENNVITQIIQKSLLQIKSEGVENVLVIDDLDRIDPNHIFRLFNVFASHLNKSDNLQNKFGFDKIIFVCDIDNIRNIFKSNYGANVDFNGYIDKFYSRKIFYYNGNAEVEKYSRKLIRNIDFRFNNDVIQQHWGTSNVGRPDLYRELIHIVSKLIMVNKLNLRRLLKETKEYVYENETINFSSIEGVPDRQNWQLNSVLIIDFLLALIGEKNDLIEALDACVNEQESVMYLEKGGLSHIFAITKVRDHKFEYDKKLDFPFDDWMVNAKLITGFRADFTRLDYKVTKPKTPVVLHKRVNDETDYNLFKLYIKGIKVLEEVGFLK